MDLVLEPGAVDACVRALFEAFLFGSAQAEIGTGALVLKKAVADPSGFPAAGRTRDQPGVLHGQKASDPGIRRPGNGNHSHYA